MLKLHIEPSRAERPLDGGDEFLVSPEAGKGVKDSIVDSTAVGGDTDPEKKVDFKPAEDGGDKIPLSAGEAGAEEFVFDMELGEAEESSLTFSKAFSFFFVFRLLIFSPSDI